MISIHAPREGGDQKAQCAQQYYGIFQSTPPARGATFNDILLCSMAQHFNPRPPRGGRRGRHICSAVWCLFQSTPPARGATKPSGKRHTRFYISIHAPREGGDLCGADGDRQHHHFNPRPPRGGRRVNYQAVQTSVKFQSTPPARGATGSPPRPRTASTYFNPRPPRGGRRDLLSDLRKIEAISIHAPREGGDMTPNLSVLTMATFQSTPPARGATARLRMFWHMQCISIHAPREGGD